MRWLVLTIIVGFLAAEGLALAELPCCVNAFQGVIGEADEPCYHAEPAAIDDCCHRTQPPARDCCVGHEGSACSLADMSKRCDCNAWLAHSADKSLDVPPPILGLQVLAVARDGSDPLLADRIADHGIANDPDPPPDQDLSQVLKALLL